MSRFTGKALVITTFGILAVACGSESDQSDAAPMIANLTVSSSSVARSMTGSGQVSVADPDGLAGLRLRLTFDGPAVIPVEVLVQGTTDSILMAPVPFAFSLTNAAPVGNYALKVVAIDGTNLESNELSQNVEIY